jgi:hypothetical protein
VILHGDDYREIRTAAPSIRDLSGKTMQFAPDFKGGANCARGALVCGAEWEPAAFLRLTTDADSVVKNLDRRAAGKRAGADGGFAEHDHAGGVACGGGGVDRFAEARALQEAAVSGEFLGNAE